MLPFEFDWKNPDYIAVFEWRRLCLDRIRRNDKIRQHLLIHYRSNPIDFITDWGMTHDPRNVERGLPATIPFIPFPKQAQWVEWALRMWRSGKRGLTDKSRGEGASWLAGALSAHLCLFEEGITIGFGSRKAEYVDGNQKSLLWKIRMFLEYLPNEFRFGWDGGRDTKSMEIRFPHTRSVIHGECGDSIGRGDRTSIYFVDEAAFLEHPDLAESSLSDTTNCRIDISTPNGPGNAFAERRRVLPPDQVFRIHWRDDPRRDEAWYAKKCSENTAVVIAREYDCNYADSIDFVLIPAEWVSSAIDAHKKLGIEPTGIRRGGLDVADQGIDKNAFVGRHGILITYAKSWSGKGSDIFETVTRAFHICDEHNYHGFSYDADGLGSGVRGDARVINEKRREADLRTIGDEPFQGSGEVWDPDGEMVPERKNKNLFMNAKAQSWWALRLRFQATHRAVVEGKEYDPAAIISIDSGIDELSDLTLELSQPTYGANTIGKLLVNKQPEGARSPNLADACMIAFNPGGNWAEMWMRLGRG